jgi:hypothetical protein
MKKVKRIRKSEVDKLIAGEAVLHVVEFNCTGEGMQHEFVMLTDDQAHYVAELLESAKKKKHIQHYDVVFAIDGICKQSAEYVNGMREHIESFDKRKARKA